MIFFNPSSTQQTYLPSGKQSPSRNAIKLSGYLGVFLALCALSIWAFTPISSQLDYTLSANLNHQLTSASVGSSSRLIANDIRAIQTKPSIYRSSAQNENKTVPSYPLTNSQDLLITGTHGTAVSNYQEINDHIKRFTIKSGDNLTKLFADADLPISLAIQLAQTPAAQLLNHLSLGNALRIFKDINNQWTALEYDVNKLETLVVRMRDGEFEISTDKKQVTFRQFTAQGVIQSSLSAAAEVANLPIEVAYHLIEIYQWEIDFARDLQVGDTFSVIYQKAYIDGAYIDDGPILAASFTASGRTIHAVRYTDDNGLTAYFQPNGESLRRGFLRTPIKLARVTSGYGKRLHPIHKKWLTHTGVDYGAKRGTSILSTADGVIQYAGTKGGYGKTIILRHGGIYTTLYAHLSKYGKGIRAGKTVHQGQVIGYVGHTGWATGDHLHYEFRINGRHKNPLKVKFPKTLPIAKTEIRPFTKKAKPLLALLTSLKGIQVAKNINAE